MRSVQLRYSNRVRQLDLPKSRARIVADTGYVELDEAVARYERLADERNAAQEAAAQARRELEQAIADDHASLAQAHFDGKARKPNDEAVREARGKLDAADRTLLALGLGVDQALDAILATLDEHSAKWAQQAAEERDRLREQAGESLQRALDDRRAYKRAASFAEALAHDDVSFKLNAGGMLGEMPFGPIELALKRELGLERPEPRTLGEQIIAAGREPAAGVALVDAAGTPIEVPGEAR
jgi:hypothetical protein